VQKADFEQIIFKASGKGLMRLWRIIFSVLFVLLSPGINYAGSLDFADREEGEMIRRMDGRVSAPEFPGYAEWINTDRKFKISDFRGKVVLLDFWTYCCINCMHVLPDLKRLEEKYPELVVIGVHSAKFTGERDLENIREAVVRYDIEHPVINDYRFELWNSYGIRAWPSFVLIDPAGGVFGMASGEGLYDLFDRNISRLISEFESTGLLNRERITFNLEKFSQPRGVLSYPGKLEADPKGARLFISDSNNNRLVVVHPDGRILDLVGSGEAGYRDGPFAEAAFFRPQGMAYDSARDVLYVADTENHTVRKVDFSSRRVSTVLGTGIQARGPADKGGPGTATAVSSPWDLVLLGDELIIAMAGSHQLWSLNTVNGEARVFAGSGREDIVDGPARSAQLAQPSGLTTDRRAVYFADSEVSAVRKVENGRVSTLVGKGLFEFGDLDGDLEEAKLQHPLGIYYHKGNIYVADTYNNKIKLIDPEARRIRTIVGAGASGNKDGTAGEALLNEPNDLVFLLGKFYITDTNNGLIRIYDPVLETLETLSLTGLEKLNPAGFSAYVNKLAKPVQHVSVKVKELVVTVTLKPGLEINKEAPHYLQAFSSDKNIIRLEKFEFALKDGRFEAVAPVELARGEAVITIELGLYYCKKEKTSMCFIEQAVFELPVEISGSGRGRLELLHKI